MMTLWLVGSILVDMNKYLFLALLVGLGASAETKSVQKIAFNSDQGNARIEFRALVKPGSIKIVGKSETLKGGLAYDQGKISGKLTTPLDQFDTGINSRNRHMREKYLETSKFPEAELTLSRLEILDRPVNASQFKYENLPFEGKLLLHGVEKPVSGTATLQREGTILMVDAFFKIKISDHGINQPSFAGVTMQDEIEVTVHKSGPIL